VNAGIHLLAVVDQLAQRMIGQRRLRRDDDPERLRPAALRSRKRVEQLALLRLRELVVNPQRRRHAVLRLRVARQRLVNAALALAAGGVPITSISFLNRWTLQIACIHGVRSMIASISSNTSAACSRSFAAEPISPRSSASGPEQMRQRNADDQPGLSVLPPIDSSARRTRRRPSSAVGS
jgi:hypothetical protein